MMFSVKSKKRSPSTLAPSRQNLERETNSYIRQPGDSLEILQRSLGNSYLQALNQGANSEGLYLQRACACGNSCASCGDKKDDRQRLQPKLIVGSPGDIYEQEADRVAEQVMGKAEPTIQRQVEPEEEEEKMVQGKAIATPTPVNSEQSAAEVSTTVEEVLNSPGQTLDSKTRTFMESRLGHDFSQVRVHTNGKATESARALNARAYTTKGNIVFGAGQYAPETVAGKQLLAHELTHVIQQSSALEKDFNALPGSHIQRQLITPLGQGGGFGGLMDRDRRAAAALASTPFHVCSRDLQGVLGNVANHAYIEAPPFRYAIISPLCPNSWTDNPITGTTAQKWDNSPDPCGKTRNCVPCEPKPGVTDVAQCLRDTFTSYASLSLYKALGPNSNTFAGTLARSCCAGMVPKPSRLGTVPGWDDPPAPARAGATPCPPGPTC